MGPQIENMIQTLKDLYHFRRFRFPPLRLFIHTVCLTVHL